MENATKALLIAAAVIVVILIIALGMRIFGMASEQVDNAGDMTEYQLQQHNGKFDKYLGKNQTGSNVNAMLTAVFNHNLAQESDATKVEVKAGTDLNCALGKTATTPANKVSTASRYDVEATKYENGLITEITVKTAGTSTSTPTPDTTPE